MNRLILLTTLCIGLVCMATANDLRQLIDDPAAHEILDKKCIRLGTGELLAINFQTACTAFQGPNLAKRAQRAFAQSVSKTGTVETPIITDDATHFHYLNEDSQRTNVHELYRQQTDAHTFDYIIHANGTSSFGKYDVVIHLRIIDLGEQGVAYNVVAHA